MSKKATTRSGAVLDEPVVTADMGLAAAPSDAADEDALVAPSVNAAAGTMVASGEAETNGVADIGAGDSLATAGGLDPVAAAAASGSADEGDDAGAGDEEPPPLAPAARETLFRERTAAVEHRITDLTRREQEIVRERAALDVEVQAADQQVATIAAELAEMPARISAARATLVAIQGTRGETSAKTHVEAERQREQELRAALAERARAAEAVHARVAASQEALTQEAAEIVAERAELVALVGDLHRITREAHEETGLAILAGWRADYEALSARMAEAEAALAAAQAEVERYRVYIILPGLDERPELRAAARTLLPAEESHVVQALLATIGYYEAWERLVPHLETPAVHGRPLA
ncbi:MAG TPA: hypothetical protein VGS80_05570 [Ktedonobacterales bacterium]|nr:hypothetical protein [Ktedonobacterales bacterium]